MKGGGGPSWKMGKRFPTELHLRGSRRKVTSSVTENWGLVQCRCFKETSYIVYFLMSGFSPYFKFKWDVSQYHSFLAPNCIFPSLDIQKTANKCYENCLPKAKNVLHLLCSDLAEEKEYIYFIMILYPQSSSINIYLCREAVYILYYSVVIKNLDLGFPGTESKF